MVYGNTYEAVCCLLSPMLSGSSYRDDDVTVLPQARSSQIDFLLAIGSMRQKKQVHGQLSSSVIGHKSNKGTE